MRNACRASARKRRSARISLYRWSVVSLRKTLTSRVSSRSHARRDSRASNVRPSASVSPKARRSKNGSWSASTSPRSTIDRKKAVERARGALHNANTGTGRNLTPAPSASAAGRHVLALARRDQRPIRRSANRAERRYEQRRSDTRNSIRQIGTALDPSGLVVVEVSGVRVPSARRRRRRRRRGRRWWRCG